MFPAVNSSNFFSRPKNSALSFVSNSLQSYVVFFFFQNQLMVNYMLWIARMNYGICIEWHFLLDAFSPLVITAINWVWIPQQPAAMMKYSCYINTVNLVSFKRYKWYLYPKNSPACTNTQFYLSSCCPSTQLTETSPVTFPVYLNVIKQLCFEYVAL